MTDYGLHVESGPKRRKTMAHVLQLLGCIANGPTTEEALAAAPEAIRHYRRFLARVGEPVDLDDPVETHVVEHLTEGLRMGEGDSAVAFQGELEPVSEDELETWVTRFLGMREILGRWAGIQSDAQLDAPSGDDRSRRTARAILLHVLGPSAAYLSAVLGPAPGYSAYHRRAERGEISLEEAFLESGDLLAAHIRGATPEQRSARVQKPGQIRTLRRGMRHVLEHEWEHLAELGRRQGGPQV